jgi:hypothetical protein
MSTKARQAIAPAFLALMAVALFAVGCDDGMESPADLAAPDLVNPDTCFRFDPIAGVPAGRPCTQGQYCHDDNWGGSGVSCGCCHDGRWGCAHGHGDGDVNPATC